jgi:hypothetical protein
MYLSSKQNPVIVDFHGDLPISTDPAEPLDMHGLAHWLYHNGGERKLIGMDIDEIVAMVLVDPLPQGQVEWRDESTGEFIPGPEETV